MAITSGYVPYIYALKNEKMIQMIISGIRILERPEMATMPKTDRSHKTRIMAATWRKGLGRRPSIQRMIKRIKISQSPTI